MQKKSWLYLSWPILLKSTRRLRNYFMMITIIFSFKGNLKRGAIFVHQCFYLSTQNVFRYLKLTIYRLRVVEKGSTAGGAKSMSSNILLFQENIYEKHRFFTRVRVIHAKNSSRRLQKPHKCQFPIKTQRFFGTSRSSLSLFFSLFPLFPLFPHNTQDILNKKRWRSEECKFLKSLHKVSSYPPLPSILAGTVTLRSRIHAGFDNPRRLP
jgi:hypothetical protein